VVIRRLRTPAPRPAAQPHPDTAEQTTATPPYGDALIEDLYTHHGAALLAYIHGLGLGHQDAEDVVQETMVRAWRHRARLDPTTGAIRGWLYTVARNIVIDRFRKRSAIPAGIQPPEAEPAEDHGANVVDRVMILNALARLTPEHRLPVVEVFYRGRTVDSVAASIGVPVGTVKSRLHYGLRNLRRILDTDGSEPPRDPRRGEERREHP
jgi:RNA polymerase sigma-70 factor, ECF subfamily